MADDYKQTVYKNFKEQVNMTASQLKKWLTSDDAKSVGWSKTEGKKTSVSGAKTEGYKSGELIISIMEKKKDDLTDKDYKQMKRTVSYIKRHMAQKPTKESVEDSRWRYSLMNWGHDPLKQIAIDPYIWYDLLCRTTIWARGVVA